MNKFHIIIGVGVLFLLYTVCDNNKLKKIKVPTIEELGKKLRIEGFEAQQNGSPTVEEDTRLVKNTFNPDANVISEYSPLTLENKKLDLSKLNVDDLMNVKENLYSPMPIENDAMPYDPTLEVRNAGSGDLDAVNRKYHEELSKEYFDTLKEMERRGGNSHNGK